MDVTPTTDPKSDEKPSLPDADLRPDQRRDYDPERPDPTTVDDTLSDLARARSIVVRVAPVGPGPADWRITVDTLGIDPWSAERILEEAIAEVHSWACPFSHEHDEYEDDEYEDDEE